MEDRLAVISCIISNPEPVVMVNKKLHLQSGMTIARLGVPYREYGVSVISIVMHRTQNQISSFIGDLGKVGGMEVKSIQVPVVNHQPRTSLQRGRTVGHMEALLSLMTNVAILIFEFIGVDIIIYSGLTGFSRFLRHSPDTKIYLAKDLAMGLGFKMGGEILHTVMVRERKEIRIVADITALRTAPTFLIHWEIRGKEKVEHDSLSLQPQSVQSL